MESQVPGEGPRAAHETRPGRCPGGPSCTDLSAFAALSHGGNEWRTQGDRRGQSRLQEDKGCLPGQRGPQRNSGPKTSGSSWGARGSGPESSSTQTQGQAQVLQGPRTRPGPVRERASGCPTPLLRSLLGNPRMRVSHDRPKVTAIAVPALYPLCPHSSDPGRRPCL